MCSINNIEPKLAALPSSQCPAITEFTAFTIKDLVRPCSTNGRRKIAQNSIGMPKQRRIRGRPKKNWMEGIKKAIHERNRNEGQWEDRKQWSLGVGQRRKTF